jgi:hypothetical protein
MLFIAKPDKIKMLRAYCKRNDVGCYEIIENIPIGRLNKFEKFLVDNEIEDDTTFPVPVPAKNTEMLKELQEFADKNNFIIEIEDTEAMIIDIPIVVSDSPEFEELLRKLELEFEKEMKE